ncbi:hypothetical protein EVA_06534 [gut metagenome]|uniref:Uncharacterized protein n=1 Tax=gut metagenome TaxID=749906 RepID=J9GEM5_9ZZZZ
MTTFSIRKFSRRSVCGTSGRRPGRRKWNFFSRCPKVLRQVI